MTRLSRLAYLIAQHPVRLHKALVRRGLLTGWVADVAPFLSEPGLPVDTPMGFEARRYQLAAAYAASTITDATRYHSPEARCMLYSFLKRRELHPLRWLPWAWALRNCKSILEYGAGAAPLAHGLTTAWPFKLPQITVADIEWPLLDYCRWRFKDVDNVHVVNLLGHIPPWYLPPHEGVVITEAFEHLPEPLETAKVFTTTAQRIVFDYVDGGGEEAGRRERDAVLAHFRQSGRLRGPSRRGGYVWEAPGRG